MENELKKRFGGGWYWLAMLANICRMTVGRMIDRYNEDQMRREEGQIKVIRRFFVNHNKNFRWNLGDYEKHIFSPFEGL